MIYDLAIIGGGAGGITAAIYAARQRMETILITKRFGGQMGNKATEVCNYPGFPRIGGAELIKKFVAHLNAQKCVEIKFAEVRKISKEDHFVVITTEGEEIASRSVIIATGADPRPLEIPGEKEFLGKGLSYCVTCDGPLFKNKAVAIIGGGNAGLEAGIFMTNYAKKIYILENGPEIRAEQANQDEVKELKKIEVLMNVSVKEIKGGKLVSSLIYEDSITKEEKALDVQGVFVEIGSQPATSLAKGLVDFNDKDEIKVEFETFQTKTPGLFAVGDANAGKYKQIVTAAGEGCKAALAAYEYIKKQK